MRVTVLFLLVVSVLNGCKNASGGGAGVSSGSTWTAEQLSAANNNCALSARDSYPNISFMQASTVCSCLFKAAQTRWIFEEFAANEAAYTKKLQDDGTMAECAKSEVNQSASSGALGKYSGSWRSDCLPTTGTDSSIRSAQVILQFNGSSLVKEFRDYRGPNCLELSNKVLHNFGIKDDGIAAGIEADKLNLTRRETILRYFHAGDALLAGQLGLYNFNDWAVGVEHNINNRSSDINVTPQFLLDQMTFDIAKISGSRLYLGDLSSNLNGTTPAKRPDKLDFSFGFNYLWDPNTAPVFLSLAKQVSILGEKVFIEAVDPDGDQVLFKCLKNCPDGFSIHESKFSWTPPKAGVFLEVTVEATDGQKNTIEKFDIIVNPSVGTPSFDVEARYPGREIILTNIQSANADSIMLATEPSFANASWQPISQSATLPSVTPCRTSLTIYLKARSSAQLVSSVTQKTINQDCRPQERIPLLASKGVWPGEITLSWNYPSNNLTYNLYYSTESGVTKSAQKISNVVSPKVVAGLDPGETYYFKISAQNSFGESEYLSQEITANAAALAKQFLNIDAAEARSIRVSDDGAIHIAGGLNYRVGRIGSNFSKEQVVRDETLDLGNPEILLLPNGNPAIGYFANPTANGKAYLATKNQGSWSFEQAVSGYILNGTINYGHSSRWAVNSKGEVFVGYSYQSGSLPQLKIDKKTTGTSVWTNYLTEAYVNPHYIGLMTSGEDVHAVYRNTLNSSQGAIYYRKNLGPPIILVPADTLYISDLVIGMIKFNPFISLTNWDLDPQKIQIRKFSENSWGAFATVDYFPGSTGPKPSNVKTDPNGNIFILVSVPSDNTNTLRIYTNRYGSWSYVSLGEAIMSGTQSIDIDSNGRIFALVFVRDNYTYRPAIIHFD